MKDSYAVLIAVSIGVLFAAAIAVPMVLSGYSGITGLQRGSFFGGMMTTQGQAISVVQAVQMMKNVPQYASVIKSNNTIIFNANSSQSIRIVALATDHEGAANLITSAAPSHATDDLFVIYGLVDPTLVISRGVTMEVVVVNLDKDMYHNFAITTIGPPYSYMAMQQEMPMMGNWQQRGLLVAMMPFLPPANYNQGIVHEYTYTVTLNDPQSTLWYFCIYPGHAQEGMYGKMLVS